MLGEKREYGDFDNERMLKSTLNTKVVKFSEAECRYIFLQLLDVIEYLSSEDIGVCHRDINPNNLMLELE